MSHENFPPHNPGQDPGTDPGFDPNAQSPERYSRQEFLETLSLAAEGTVAWEGSVDLPQSDVKNLLSASSLRDVSNVPVSHQVTETDRSSGGSSTRGDRTASRNDEYLNDVRVRPDYGRGDHLSFIPCKDGTTEVRYDFMAPPDKFGRPNLARVSFRLPSESATELLTVVDADPSVVDAALEQIITKDFRISQESYNSLIKPSHSRGEGNIVIRDYNTAGEAYDIPADPSKHNPKVNYNAFVEKASPLLRAEAAANGYDQYPEPTNEQLAAQNDPAPVESDKPTEPIPVHDARKAVAAAYDQESTKEGNNTDAELVEVEPLTPEEEEQPRRDKYSPSSPSSPDSESSTAENTEPTAQESYSPRRSAGFTDNDNEAPGHSENGFDGTDTAKLDDIYQVLNGIYTQQEIQTMAQYGMTTEQLAAKLAARQEASQESTVHDTRDTDSDDVEENGESLSDDAHTEKPLIRQRWGTSRSATKAYRSNVAKKILGDKPIEQSTVPTELADEVLTPDISQIGDTSVADQVETGQGSELSPREMYERFGSVMGFEDKNMKARLNGGTNFSDSSTFSLTKSGSAGKVHGGELNPSNRSQRRAARKIYKQRIKMAGLLDEQKRLRDFYGDGIDNLNDVQAAQDKGLRTIEQELATGNYTEREKLKMLQDHYRYIEINRKVADITEWLGGLR